MKKHRCYTEGCNIVVPLEGELCPNCQDDEDFDRSLEALADIRADIDKAGKEVQEHFFEKIIKIKK